MIHDATHGLAIKSKISPMAGDLNLKRAVQVFRGACFLLTGDVARAHYLGSSKWQRAIGGISAAARLQKGQMWCGQIALALSEWLQQLMNGIG